MRNGSSAGIERAGGQRTSQASASLAFESPSWPPRQTSTQNCDCGGDKEGSGRPRDRFAAAGEVAAAPGPAGCSPDRPSARLHGQGALAWMLTNQFDCDRRRRSDVPLGQGAVGAAERGTARRGHVPCEVRTSGPRGGCRVNRAMSLRSSVPTIRDLWPRRTVVAAHAAPPPPVRNRLHLATSYAGRRGASVTVAGCSHNAGRPGACTSNRAEAPWAAGWPGSSGGPQPVIVSTRSLWSLASASRRSAQSALLSMWR